VITHIDDRPETRRSAPPTRRLSKSLTAAVVALIAGLTLSGCTSSSAPAATPPTASTTTTGASSTAMSVSTSARVPPTVVSSSVSSSTTLPSSTTAKSTAPTKTKLTSAPRPTTTALWPATLTPGQITEAKSALAAFTAYYAVFDKAFAHPDKDWSASFAKVASDPEKSSTLRYLKATAKLGQYGSGHIRLISRVTKVQTAIVELTVCVDTSNVGFFDKTGRSIKAPDAPGSYYRHPAKVGVYEFVGNQWLVTTINNDFSKTC